MLLVETFRWRSAGCCAAAFILLACVASAQSPAQAPRPVTDRELLEPDPADWLMWRRTLNSWGYSPLNQIDKRQRRRGCNWCGRAAWVRAFRKATPLVHDGVMYLPNPSDYIQAIDAATGDLRWEYKRKLPEDLSKFLPVPSINRNLAIYGNQIIDTSADDFCSRSTQSPANWPGRTRIVDYREDPRAGNLGSDHRQRQDFLDARLRVQGQPGRLHHHGARRQDRQGAVADAHHPEARRAGR